MARIKNYIETTRASRDGHEFHESWAARKSLQLILPNDKFVGIAIEGLDPEDQKNAPQETVQIADATLYYGKGTNFNKADEVHIVQLKYSIGRETVPFRFSDSEKTIKKFAKTFQAYKHKYGNRSVEQKLRFEIVTNRPIAEDLELALESIRKSIKSSGKAKKQAALFKSACKFKKKELSAFANKITLIGLAGNLSSNKKHLFRALASWSAGCDPVSRAWLGGMCSLLREKAGLAGQGRNVIRKVDVLDALGVTEEDLFPCREVFPPVGPIVEREQLSDVVKILQSANAPYLIHASAGTGKTVFLQDVAAKISQEHEVFVFDCFGGGAYRAPEDSRHLPSRGLIHIANNFARRGLCDPIIPSSADDADLIKAFRSRLSQSLETLRTASPDKKFFLFIDAADNAADFAREQNQSCFPKLLLQSFTHGTPLLGVQLVLSCRTERRNLVKGENDCLEFGLNPFSPTETEAFLKTRVRNLKTTEIQVAHARSGGNPRILEHLIHSDRGLLEPSETNKRIELDEVLEARIQNALKDAKKQGHKESEIVSFLTSLAVLPPPVPIEDLAMVQGMDISAINSFVVDLAPMLEKTRHGIWFRDEPTETLIRNKYKDNEGALRLVAENLFKQQNSSVYAARALPRLLQSRGDEKMLLELAFSENFPASITSTVGKQAIRYARLKAAVAHAATKKNYNHLVRLLVELSTIAASGERGLKYIIENPDLIVAFKDVDATRRLFESRTSWQGTRHARLCIAHLLQSAPDEASRHAVQAEQWINHYFEQKEHEKPGPTPLDIAAIPLLFIAQGRYKDAAQWIDKRWKKWYGYKVSQEVFCCLATSKAISTSGVLDGKKFVDALDGQLPPLVAAITYQGLDKKDLTNLISKLAESCRKIKQVEASGHSHAAEEPIHAGLLKAAASALALNLKTEALDICSVLPLSRPLLWSMTDRDINPYSQQNIFPFLFSKVIQASAEGRGVCAREILPSEFQKYLPAPEEKLDEAAFLIKLKKTLKEAPERKPDQKEDNGGIFLETKNQAIGFLDGRLNLFLRLLHLMGELIRCPWGEADKNFLLLVKQWAEVFRSNSDYRRHEIDFYFDSFGKKLILFCLSVRTDLTVNACQSFLEELEKGRAWTSTIIAVIEIIAPRQGFQELAGTLAKKVEAAIEKEDDVNHRSSLFARLARAIMPTSKDEASNYFRSGLEQMDIVGSGDYDFVSELIVYTASMNGAPLAAKDFHAFTNICELNIYEVDKFDWPGFGIALANAAGLSGIAKLTRWDDRAKVSIDYSLMPFLGALVENGQLAPTLAVCLLRLCSPLGTWTYSFSDFSKLILEKETKHQKELASELVQQFTSNYPAGAMSDSVEKLIATVEAVMGDAAQALVDLKKLQTQSKKAVREYNEKQNFDGRKQEPLRHLSDDHQKGKSLVENLISKTVPGDFDQLTKAIDTFEESRFAYELKERFFDGLRRKLAYGDRSSYLDTVANHPTFNFYWKLEELAKCKNEWKASSSLEDKFEKIGRTLLIKHSDDLISYSHLSFGKITEISELSGVKPEELTLALVEYFSRPEIHIPSAVWLGLATKIIPKISTGEPQQALARLLQSNASKLSSSVGDGAWRDDLYPQMDQNETTAAMVWFKLGAPSAADRWRAAHSVRALAKLGRWDVVELLVSKYGQMGAIPLQASELVFYNMHARLWLLIALARVAIDYPKEIAVHAKVFKAITLDKSFPHVLIRHFAIEILMICDRKGSIMLTSSEKIHLARVNCSPFSSKQSNKHSFGFDSWGHKRPDGLSEPTNSFNLNYEFQKYEVNSMRRIFDKDSWEVDDKITAWVRKHDQNIKGMYENGGRERPGRRDSWSISPKFHVYGEYLGWHGLFLTAGELLSQTPVVSERNDDSWQRWLEQQLLTRSDGLWLSDGTDNPPIDTLVNLLESRSLGITGKKELLLSLVGISSSETIGDDLVVEGDWKSYDGIDVSISSALITRGKGNAAAKKMATQKPHDVWLPCYQSHETGDEFIHSDTSIYEPWVVNPQVTFRLDEHDPLGTTEAMLRPYFCKKIRQLLQLRPTDPFNRTWMGAKKSACFASAWGNGEIDRNERNPHGRRLNCSKMLLKKALNKLNTELVILIKLTRYESGHHLTKSKFSYTTAVVRIDKNLAATYYPGKINWFLNVDVD